MRRLYIVPYQVWKDELHKFVHPSIGSHGIHLIDYASQENAELLATDRAAWEALPEVQEWKAAGGLMLMSTSFAHSEYSEDIWHSHPDVAILPHPVQYGNRKIATRAVPLLPGQVTKAADVLDPDRKIKQVHIDALKKCRVRSTGAQLGFDEQNDTVLTLAEKAARVDPLLKLRAVL